jgi:hypothetical protein
MNWNEKDYEAVALYLDGQDVTLSDSQSELARQIAGDFKALAPKLNVAVPEEILRRVRDKMPMGRPTVRRGLYIGLAATAAAAVVLLAVGVRSHWTTVRADAITPSEYVSAYLGNVGDEQEPTEVLSGQIALTHDDWAASADSLEQELTELDRPSETD